LEIFGFNQEDIALCDLQNDPESSVEFKGGEDSGL